MPTQAQLIARFHTMASPETPSDAQALAYLNENQLAIAGGIMLPSGELSFPLPDLQTSKSVTTSTSAAYIQLPLVQNDAFHRDLFLVVSSTHDIRIKIEKSWQKFIERDYKQDDAGQVEAVCVRGNRLYYNPIPASAETLVLHYFRKPVDMTSVTGTDISFTASSGTVARTAGGLGVFAVGQKIDITGSSSNNNALTNTAIAAAGTSLTVDETLTDEAAGATVVIKGRPDGIPEHLQYKILVNAALASYFSDIAHNQGDRYYAKAEKHRGDMLEALVAMQNFNGPPTAEPETLSFDEISEW